MSVAQTDIFGGSQTLPGAPVEPVRTIKDMPTCWDDCDYCGKSPLSYRGKLFYQCLAPGKEHARCFKGDLACDKARLRPQEVPLKPQTVGWADY